MFPSEYEAKVYEAKVADLRPSCTAIPLKDAPAPCLPGADGAIQEVLASALAASAPRIAEDAFSEALVRGLLRYGHLVVVALVQGRIVYASPGLWELVDRSCPELRGSRAFVDLLHEADRSRIAELIQSAEDFRTKPGTQPGERSESPRENPGAQFVASCLLADRGRESVAIRLAAHHIECEGVATLALIVTDVTAQLRQRSRLEFLDTHDPVTGLINRVALLEAAKHAITSAQLRDESLAFLLVDLDHFGELNDSAGPAVGDAALKIVGDRLERSVRGKGDLLGRYGGDEFLLVFRHIEERDSAALVAGRIIESLGQPMVAVGHKCRVGASVGIALCPQDGAGLSALLAHANAALFLAKGTGRNRFAFAEASDDIILAIEPMKWRSEMDIGIAAIDAQHHQLNAAINALAQDLRSGAELGVLRAKIEDLTGLLAAHFATEERILDLHPRPENAEHKHEHQRLLADLRWLLTGYQRSNLALATRHVYDWLGRHIQTFDRHLPKPGAKPNDAAGGQLVGQLGRQPCGEANRAPKDPRRRDPDLPQFAPA
jgi:diguanylate cyclase (GGDEF)-like protein/hemerythrin-like metal-binding protein